MASITSRNVSCQNQHNDELTETRRPLAQRAFDAISRQWIPSANYAHTVRTSEATHTRYCI
jgi:hypothetical protein